MIKRNVARDDWFVVVVKILLRKALQELRSEIIREDGFEAFDRQH